MSGARCPHCGRTLRTEKLQRWTTEEVEILKAVYLPQGPEAVHDHLPHRTIAAIHAAAARHNIPSPGRYEVQQVLEADTEPSDFDAWCEEHSADLWAEYHESGANYDTDYAVWLQERYERLFASTK